jgi:hypothetical protein
VNPAPLRSAGCCRDVTQAPRDLLVRYSSKCVGLGGAGRPNSDYGSIRQGCPQRFQHGARSDRELFQLHAEPTALHQDVTDNRYKRVLNCEDTLRGLPDGFTESKRPIGVSPVDECLPAE